MVGRLLRRWVVVGRFPGEAQVAEVVVQLTVVVIDACGECMGPRCLVQMRLQADRRS